VNRTLFFPISGFWILASGFSHAILDTNNNGVSDLWEREYNAGELFDESFDPQADDDHDGWTNERESAAGTDHLDPNPPVGIIRPNIVHIPSVYGEPDVNGVSQLTSPAAIILSWPTIAGKQYILLVSPDLQAASWIPVDAPFIGYGGEVEYRMPFTQPDGSIPEKLFWRVAVNNIDTDNDGLANSEEITLGLDSEKPQTIPGIPDLWLAENFYYLLKTGGATAIDPNGDPDEDGTSTNEELQDSTDPNTPDDPSARHWVTVNGTGGEEDETITRTGTLTIPAGQSAILIIAIASDEYPTFTGTPSQYNDTMDWDITLSEGPAIQDSISVNDRHTEWEAAAQSSTSLLGLTNPVHFEKIQTLTAPVDQDLTLQVSLSVTNISDAKLPSCVSVGVLPVELINSEDIRLDKLKVAKMIESGVLDTDKTITASNDRDNFRIRVRGGASLDQISFKVSTADNPDSGYDDDSTQIDLSADDEDAISGNMILVADEEDDDQPIEEIADDNTNDKSHQIQLGGNFVIDAIKLGSESWQPIGFKTLVPVKKTVQIHAVILRNKALAGGGIPVVSYDKVAEYLKITKERYAQVGVDIDVASVGIQDPPSGVDLSDGLNIMIAPTDTTIANEARSMIEGKGTVGSSDIHIFFVNRLAYGTGPQFGLGGFAFADFALEAGEDDYTYNAFVAAEEVSASNKRGGLVTAHELGHLLRDSGHAGNIGDIPEIQLMIGGGVAYTNGVLNSKRFSNSDETKIQGNSHAH
jgi:hypothetical protein